MKRKLCLKKEMMVIACIIALCLMVCACSGSGDSKSGSAQAGNEQQGGAQSGSEQGSAQTENEQSENTDKAPDEVEANTANTADALSDSTPAGEADNGWKAAYASFISGLKAEGEESQMPNIVQFAFVDEDDVPEMAVYFTEEGTTYSFYTYSEGEVRQLGEDIPYFITLNIISKENKFVYSFSKGRYREDAFGSISDGKMVIVPYGVEDREDEDASVFTWLDEEVTEEVYLENVSKLLDGREADTIVGMARHAEDVDNEQFFTVDDAITYLTGA